MLRVVGILLVLLVAGCDPAAAPSGAQATDDHQHHAEGGTGAHNHGDDTEAVGDGRSPDAAGYALADLSYPGEPGEDTLSFRIIGRDGTPHRRFQVEQSKLMHVYVVRTDLAEFDHVHPEMAEDGTWRAPLTLERNGTYRVVTEFVAADPDGSGTHLVLGDDITVGTEHTPEPLPAANEPVQGDGYELHVFGDLSADAPSTLKVHVLRDGTDVTGLRPYLGAFAHLTGFHRDDLTTVHLHPERSAAPGTTGGPTLSFHADFPRPGTYRLFIQFQTGDVLHTVPATVEVG